MASEKTDDKRILIQKTLFRTVSRSLIRQLYEQGCSFRDLVDFANEILEEITLAGTIDKSMSSDNPSDPQGGGIEVVPVERALAEQLHNQDRVNLTAEVYMRRIAEPDITAINRWSADEAVSASPAARTLDKIVSDPARALSKESAALFVICREADDVVVGLIGFPHIEAETRQAEYIKMIGEPAERGKGYARIGTNVLLEYAFSFLNLNRVYIYTLDGNLRNISLNQSLGFSFEGLLKQAVLVDNRLRDVAVMALVKS